MTLSDRLDRLAVQWLAISALAQALAAEAVALTTEAKDGAR